MGNNKSSKKDFITNYAKNSNLSVKELLDLGFIAIPCNCEYKDCKGWKAEFKNVLKRQRG